MSRVSTVSTGSRRAAAPQVDPSQPFGGSRQDRPELRLVPEGRIRRPLLAGISVVVVVVSTALFTLIYLHGNKLEPVIGIAHQVSVGQTVELADLRQVDVSSSGEVATIPVGQAPDVIGKEAAVTLVAGTLLTPQEISVRQAVQSGQAVVGADLKPGMFPPAGLEPGQPVEVVLTQASGSSISTPAASSNSSSNTPSNSSSGSSETSRESDGSSGTSAELPSYVITSAVVENVDDSPDGLGTGDISVSLQVPSSIAPALAEASAAGQVALVITNGDG